MASRNSDDGLLLGLRRHGGGPPRWHVACNIAVRDRAARPPEGACVASASACSPSSPLVAPHGGHRRSGSADQAPDVRSPAVGPPGVRGRRLSAADPSFGCPAVRPRATANIWSGSTAGSGRPRRRSAGGGDREQRRDVDLDAGPMVRAIVSRFRYWPFAPAGLARLTASTSAGRFSTLRLLEARLAGPGRGSAALVDLGLDPAGLDLADGGSMSNVDRAGLGFGIRPRGPRIRPRRPTLPIVSGVAIATSNSSQPPRSSWRGPRRRPRRRRRAAPLGLLALANTATRTTLPVPWGSTTVPRTIWSAWRGSTPSRRCASTSRRTRVRRLSRELDGLLRRVDAVAVDELGASW